MSRHGRPEEKPHGFIEVRTLVVKETRTRVNVLWQDGTREWLDARDTIPYLNPDEYDCWYVILCWFLDTYTKAHIYGKAWGSCSMEE